MGSWITWIIQGSFKPPFLSSGFAFSPPHPLFPPSSATKKRNGGIYPSTARNTRQQERKELDIDVNGMQRISANFAIREWDRG